MSSLAPGLRLHDRFTLVERVGVGGMSQVWRALDEVLGRSVAVKVLDSALAAEPALQQATWREARAAARLAHPHVIQVFDYGEAALADGTPVPYLVMELVEGESLAARLRGGGPLPWAEAVRIGAQIAAALAAAHRLGIVHRDVKPANVMLTRAGAKVLDFGIAGLAGTRSDAGEFLVGTPAYAAPEQLHSSLPQRASDVYALGVVLYQTLTGHLPSPAANWADAAATHRSRQPVPPLRVPGLPPHVTRLVMAAIADEPGERPSAEALASGLAAAVGLPDPTGELHDRTAALPMLPPQPEPGAAARGAAPPPPPPTMIQREYGTPFGPAPGTPPRSSRRRMLLALIGAVVAAALAVAAVAAMVDSGGPARVPDAAVPSTTTSAPPSATAAPSATTPTPRDTVPTSRPAILAELDRTIAAAAADGAMGDEAARQLRDRIDQLSDPDPEPDARGKGKQRKQTAEAQRGIDELQERVDDLRADGEVAEETADRLLTLLQALSRTQPAAEDEE